MTSHTLFQSFFLGGFECSTHRARSGRRLDLVAATGHDRFAAKDYALLQSIGICTVRDGIRWHLVEPHPGEYDFSSALPMLRAARETGMQVLWDICHYGWPDHIDIFQPEFIDRYAALAAGFARVLRDEVETVPIVCPMNEISFFAWAGGDVGHINPFTKHRGDELKRQLVRADIAATEAIWSVIPGARIAQVDPVIHIVHDADRPEDRDIAEGYRRSMFQAWDMIDGRMNSELGGSPKYLDIIGINYYPTNQWIHEGITLDRSHPQYRPFREIIREVYERYRRPIFIAETGIEDDARADWLRYVASEAFAALRSGVPVEGLCWYPILNYPGWDDDRHCYCGLLDYPDENGDREIHQPLADEFRCQMAAVEEADRACDDITRIPSRQQLLHVGLPLERRITDE